MLTSGGKKLIRYDYGRMLPTNYGFFRLFRLWVEGKVEKIYLPEWWISTHFQEAERLEKERFGNYALVIAHQYKNATSQIQKRWGLVLNELGIGLFGDKTPSLSLNGHAAKLGNLTLVEGDVLIAS